MSKTNNKINDNHSGSAVGIIIMLILAVVPIITRLAVVSVSPIEKSLIRSAESVNDIFSYNKSIALIILTCIMLGCVLVEAVTSDSFHIFDFKRPHFIMICIFALLAVISSVFSKYKPVSFSGISERYEGLWVILCYCALFAVSSYYVKDKKSFGFVTAGFFLSALFVGIIGFSQLIGHDIFKLESVTKFVLGKYYKPGMTLTMKFDEIYSTLYNPNCVGLFSSMLTMFFGAFAVILPLKNPLKYISLFFALFMLIMLIGSGSAAGAVGVFCSIAFLAVLGFIYLIKNKSFKTLILAALLIAAACTAILMTPSIQNKLKNAADSNPVERLDYRSWEFDGYTSSITTRSGTFKVIFDPETRCVKIINYDGTQARCEDGVYYLSDRAFTADIGENSFSIKEAGESSSPRSFLFGIGDGEIYPLSKKGNPIEGEAASFGFKGNEYFASSRGYIWSRSIPIAFKHILIGSGCDTFSFEFPQDDVTAKIKFLGNQYVIIDKPHSMFIQTAVNTGMLSLVIFIGINILFTVKAVKNIFKSKNNLYSASLAGVTGGVIAFLVTAMAVDSTVCVTPVYCILLGMGFSLVYNNPERRKSL